MLTATFRSKIPLSMAMVGTEAHTRRTERLNLGWRSEMAMSTTPMVVLESCSLSLDARHHTIYSRVPSKGVTSILLRYASRAAMVVGLMESVEIVSRFDAAVDAVPQLQLRF